MKMKPTDKEILKQAGLESKAPRLAVNRDMTFRELPDKKFDFLHAQSVLSHMPREDIEELFKNLYKAMKAESQFFATFFESKNDRYYSTVRKQNFFYPFSFMQTLADKYGLCIDRVQDALKKQQLVRITLRPDEKNFLK